MGRKEKLTRLCRAWSRRLAVDFGLDKGTRPGARTFRHYANRCRHTLAHRIAPFFLPGCVDGRGGYLEDNENGRFFSRGEKFVVMQARDLWFFSFLIEAGVKTAEARGAAGHGFRYIEDFFMDRLNGGYFAKVADDGAPLDRSKHLYQQSFVLYGLSRYAAATDSAEARQAATRLFETILYHIAKSEGRGFNEVFGEDWRPILEGEMTWDNCLPGARSIGVHLHLMEAVSEYFLLVPSAAARSLLMELVEINATFFKHPEHAATIAYLWPDGRVVDDKASRRSHYGHDVELAWLMLDAMHRLGEPIAEAVDFARGVVEYVLRYGFDRTYGGVYLHGPFGKAGTDRSKVWWVQGEAMVAFLEMFRLTRDPKYFRAFVRTLEFYERYSFAPDGGDRAALNRRGNGRSPVRASLWQGPYHSGRSMGRCADLLATLSAEEDRGLTSDPAGRRASTAIRKSGE